MNPFDHLALYHIAHTYSLQRRLSEAIEYVQKSLKVKPNDTDSLHLLALLLTATKSYDEAYTVIVKASSQEEDYK